MSSMEFTISEDIFDEETGVYTCKINFLNDIDQSLKDKLIKKHIMSLNYNDINYVFLPEFGSKVSAALSGSENKNIVNLKIVFVKIDVNVRFVKSFEKSNSLNRPPPPPPRNKPFPNSSNLNNFSFSDLKKKMWIKEVQNHPEYASLNSHQYYSSFQDAILSCSSEAEKENIYKYYCKN